MLQKLLLELLVETIGYIHLPSHLKALCLVSKTVSSVATQLLWRNLVLDFPLLPAAGENGVDIFDAVLMSNGLRFVKTLKVGPIRGKTVALFDRLMCQFKDHSLINFEWDPDEPPLNSQLRYIWDHQWNIQSIDLTKMANAVETVQPCEGRRFPQKYVHLSFTLPLEENLPEKLDLAYMTAVTVSCNDGERLPSCISARISHITNLQLHTYNPSSGENLELDNFTSLVSLGLYRCGVSGAILSNFKNPKLKHFHIEFDWLDIGVERFNDDGSSRTEALKAQFSFIRRFEGLETLVIDVPDLIHPASLLETLVDSISLNHNDTLRHIVLLDPCKPKDADVYTNDTIESRNSIYDAVIACPHRVHLELQSGWGVEMVNDG